MTKRKCRDYSKEKQILAFAPKRMSTKLVFACLSDWKIVISRALMAGAWKASKPVPAVFSRINKSGWRDIKRQKGIFFT